VLVFSNLQSREALSACTSNQIDRGIAGELYCYVLGTCLEFRVGINQATC